MTKTTEELKREMYQWLRLIKGSLPNNGRSDGARKGEQFEEVLEAYLEALHQERTDLRNKLQAFEFANKSAGELLRDAMATVKRQRQFIKTLYTSRKARKSKAATRTQSSKENGVGDELKRFDLNSDTIECAAKRIYDGWSACPGFLPWIDSGNSLKQDEARRIARSVLELALENQIKD
jgi:hypothetical protein